LANLLVDVGLFFSLETGLFNHFSPQPKTLINGLHEPYVA
jgi:hypothetical protein